jgi:hypothetical protein
METSRNHENHRYNKKVIALAGNCCEVATGVASNVGNNLGWHRQVLSWWCYSPSGTHKDRLLHATTVKPGVNSCGLSREMATLDKVAHPSHQRMGGDAMNQPKKQSVCQSGISSWRILSF